MNKLLSEAAVAYTFAGDSCDKYRKGLRQRAYTATKEKCTCSYAGTCKHIQMRRGTWEPPRLNADKHLDLFLSVMDYFDLDLDVPEGATKSRVQLSAQLSQYDVVWLLNSCLVVLEFSL